MAINTARRRTIWGLVLIVVVVVVCIVLLSVVLTASSDKDERPTASSTSAPPSKNTKSFFSFDDIFSFYAYLPPVKWVSDSAFLVVSGGNITMADVETNKTKLIVPKTVIDAEKAVGSLYQLSPDEKWVLLPCNYKKLYRRSYTADYIAYNLETKNITRIEPHDKTNQIQLAIWGNTGSKLAFVQNNNIYYMANITSTPLKITDTGIEHKIFNGITDWLYEEDVYYSPQAMWFSPNDTYLGYVEFNDTKVDWFSYIRYGSYLNAYPEVLKIAYPKPGMANPQVKVRVVDLENLENKAHDVLEPPEQFKNIDHYFTNMAWFNDKQVMISWSNRVQNVSIFMQYDIPSNTSFENQRQMIKDGWVDPTTYLQPNPWFSKDGSYYLTKRPFSQGQKDGDYLHIAKITTEKPGNITSLTSGKWEVNSILAFDRDDEIVYYSSSETSAREMHIYSLDLNSKTKTCLSCAVDWAKSGRCKYFTASFSNNAEWYVLYCRGPGVPISSRHNVKTGQVDILESNDGIIKSMEKRMIPQRKNFQFKSGKYMIDAMEIRPPNFDPNKKYGVLLDVYGGPGYQRVTEEFSASNTGWNAYLVSNYDIILVRINGRGQKSRGERFKHEVYLKLGEYEADDTIEAGRYMQTKPYVDKDKLAVWGWSYGGYLTTYVLSKNTGVFKVGMAVAPVTDWRYYDTAYTERYMGLLDENMSGYNQTSLLRCAKNFRNVSYLIVHGSADDNVHYQHTAQMVKALTIAEIDFRVQYYTDKAHSIVGSKTRRHLWSLLVDYMTSKLGLTKNNH